LFSPVEIYTISLYFSIRKAEDVEIGMANLRYAKIVQQTNRILSEYEYPLTLRQVYYRLVSQNTIPNTKSAYNSLSKMLVKAREV